MMKKTINPQISNKRISPIDNNFMLVPDSNILLYQLEICENLTPSQDLKKLNFAKSQHQAIKTILE